MKRILTFLLILLSLPYVFAGNLTSKIDSNRGDGFCYKFFITGPSKNWKIKFDLDINDKITSKRNGEFACSNRKCIVTSVNWNKNIENNQKIEIGFCSKGKGKPTNIIFEEEKVENNGTINNTKKIPYNIKKFKHVLEQCKLTYPDSHTKIVDKGQFQNFKTNYFYADSYDNLNFVLEKNKSNNSKIRLELRQQQNHKDSGWIINDNTIHKLIASVQLKSLDNVKNLKEYTFLQIHSEVNPLLRMVVNKEKDGKKGHIWAVVRINTNKSGKRTERYDLGKVVNSYENFIIKVGNNKLKIIKNGKTYVDKDISYWPEKKNYFKAGIYDSKNSEGSWKITIKFKELDFNQETAGNTSNENTSQSEGNTTEDNVVEDNEETNTDETENTLQNLQKYNLEKNGFKVDIKIQSKWQDGYCRQIVIENTNVNKKVTNWQLSFDFTNKLSSSWSANFTQSNGKYTITPKDWNQTLNPGDKTTVGFCLDSIIADSNWNIDLVNLEVSTDNETTNTSEEDSTTESLTQPENNATEQENNTETSEKTDENTTDINWTIQAQGDEIASYPESQWPTYKVSNKFYLEINPWNITYPADGYAKMYYDSSNSIVTYIQDLKNIKIQNVGGYVLGYPEVYVGNKPWNGNYVDAGSNLPAKVSDLKSVEVEATWKYEHPTDLSCNFAMEGWFTKTKDQSTGVGAGEIEMMIMWYRNIQNAAGSKVGEVTIPVEVNGKTKDITFDIYKANIGWDFVTFIPHNYQNFQNASVKFDAMDFVKATSKYVPQINDLYFEDWEFGTEFGTPTTTQAALRWQVREFKVTGILKNQENNNKEQEYNYNGLKVSPYVDTTLYPLLKLSDVYKKIGQKDFALVFIVSNNGKCEASWGGYYKIDKGPSSWDNGKEYFLYDEINYIKNIGGKLTISFAGASGTPLFTACNANDLQKQYEKIIDKLKVYNLDFDIEGTWITKTSDIEKLVKVLKNLKKKYSQLKISFTLPVMPDGLTNNGVNLIKILSKNNFKNAIINIMAMDYGFSYNGNMGDYAIKALENTNKQIQTYWGNGNYYNQLGVTAMIGLNDIKTEKFTLNDAEKLRDFAKKNKLALLSYWELNRDHPCSSKNVELKCSSLNLQTKDYEFLEKFNGINKNKTFTSYNKNNTTTNNQTSNDFDIGTFISTSINKVTVENKWTEKIASLEFKINTNHKYLKYENIFKKFFDDKKNKILKNKNYQDEDYYNYLKSFMMYSEWLFIDLENKNYANIKSYVDGFKKVVSKLKSVK